MNMDKYLKFANSYFTVTGNSNTDFLICYLQVCMLGINNYQLQYTSVVYQP